jgi:hypothetical protein
MNKSLSFYSRRFGLLLLLIASFALLLVPGARAQAASQDHQTAATPAAPAAQTDAEKKVAERKKRFEEQKRLLDGNAAAGAGAASHAPQKDWEFWMDPLYANMLLNETQEIHMWDWRNNDVSARVSWSLNGSGAVDMAVKHHAILTAKMPGTVSVMGQIDGKTIEAIVTVYRGEKLPSGVARTVSAPPPPNNGGKHRTSTVTVEP